MAEARSSKPRGELAELSAQLQNLCTAGKRTERELRNAKKDVFRKVINYMTLGMDMSGLFPMMTSCANLSADDLVLKKMLYLYLTHYASQTPDLALLTINQLQKDCADHDPMIRGLALRSLCSLRVANFLEYVVSPILTGLGDRHPYVRRTAVMGVLKVHHIDPASVAQQGMVDRVKRLLSTDNDVQVIANCLSVLMQLEPPSRLADKSLVYSLLNRIKDFSDWGQCTVLELASHYTPSSEAEVYDMLNALEDRMGHVNSAVVLATIRVFLRLTANMTATHQQVLERVREPLKTLISRDDAPTCHAALCHVALLAGRAPMIFEGDAPAFFCRAHDPWFVKRAKLDILAAIASQANVYDIVSELTEYARDINPTLAREAVRAVGRIALSVPDCGGIIERLLMFLDGGGSEAVTCEALVALKDVLRRYPDAAHVAAPQLGALGVHGGCTEPAARAAFVWMCGAFGGLIQDAPYLLEPFVEGFASEEPEVRLALLTACGALFFRRPPEGRGLLGAALAAGVQDGHADVRDRALLYVRLLRSDPAAAERVLAPPLMAVPWFSEALSPEAREAVFAEFNSLSVVFQQPAASFIERQAYHSLDPEPEPPAPAPTSDLLALEAPELLGADRVTNLLADADLDGTAAAAAPSGADGTAAAAAAAAAADLLDLDIGPPTMTSTFTSAAAPPPGMGMGGGGGGAYGGVGGDLGGPGAPMIPGLPSFASPMPYQPLMSPAPMQHLQQQYPPVPPQPLQPLQQAQQYGAPQQAMDLLGGFGGGGAPPPQQLLQPPRPPQAAAAPPQAAGFGGAAGRPSAAAAAAGGGGGGDFLGLGDDGLGMGLGMGGGGGGGGPAAPAPPPELMLNPKARVSPSAFQEEWKRLPPCHTSSTSLSPANVSAITANGHRDFTQHMSQAYIHTIASGGAAPNFRYYFYGQSAGPSASLFLVELLLRSDSGAMTVTVKTGEPACLPAFLELWNTCLAGFLLA